jgi:hypothetical protein
MLDKSTHSHDTLRKIEKALSRTLSGTTSAMTTHTMGPNEHAKPAMKTSTANIATRPCTLVSVSDTMRVLARVARAAIL